jgi:hypothetical protein
VAPAAIFPLSKAPVLLVTVWAIASLLVHFTVEPAVIVMVEGEKAIDCIVTVFDAGGVTTGSLLLLFEQLLTKKKIDKRANTTNAHFPEYLLIVFILIGFLKIHTKSGFADTPMKMSSWLIAKFILSVLIKWIIEQLSVH